MSDNEALSGLRSPIVLDFLGGELDRAIEEGVISILLEQLAVPSQSRLAVGYDNCVLLKSAGFSHLLLEGSDNLTARIEAHFQSEKSASRPVVFFDSLTSLQTSVGTGVSHFIVQLQRLKLREPPIVVLVVRSQNHINQTDVSSWRAYGKSFITVQQDSQATTAHVCRRKPSGRVDLSSFTVVVLQGSQQSIHLRAFGKGEHGDPGENAAEALSGLSFKLTTRPDEAAAKSKVVLPFEHEDGDLANTGLALHPRELEVADEIYLESDPEQSSDDDVDV